MQDIKYCQKCGIVISNINTADYYSHIRKKYCSSCAPDANRERAKERSARIRKQTRENNKLARELNDKLLIENKLLREQLESTREIISNLRGEGK